MSFSETQMVWAQPVGEQPHPIEMLDHGDAVASRGDLRLHLGLEKMHVDGRVVTLRRAHASATASRGIALASRHSSCVEAWLLH